MAWDEDIKTEQCKEREPYRYYADEEYPEPDMLVEFDRVGTIPKGDAVALSGKAKTCKTYCVSIWIASVLGCKDFGFTPTKQDAKVLYFDTEQSKANIARIQRRVHRLLGWDTKTDYHQLIFYVLREMQLKDRYQFIVDKVMEEEPAMIVIDGIADLISNFNDIDQSTDIISKLLALCSETNIALLTVLHENKSEDNTNMKGHLGTLLLQKAASVFHLSKSEDGTITVKNTDSRNKPIRDWYFKIDENGMPITSDAPVTEKERKEIEDLKENMRIAFEDADTLLRSELVERLKSKGLCSGATAYRKIEKAVEKNVLKLDSNSYCLSST